MGGQFPAIVRCKQTDSELALRRVGDSWGARVPFPWRLAGVLFCSKARKDLCRHLTSSAASSHRLPAEPRREAARGPTVVQPQDGMWDVCGQTRVTGKPQWEHPQLNIASLLGFHSRDSGNKHLMRIMQGKH